MTITLTFLPKHSEKTINKPIALQLDSPRIVLGRSLKCDVTIPEESVALRHASIREKEGHYVLFDEDNLNGSFVNEKRVPQKSFQNIKSGDRIRLGRIEFEFTLSNSLIELSSKYDVSQFPFLVLPYINPSIDPMDLTEETIRIEQNAEFIIPISLEPQVVKRKENPFSENREMMTPIQKNRMPEKSLGVSWKWLDGLTLLFALGLLALSVAGWFLLRK